MELPLPALLYVSSLGFAFASAMKSLVVVGASEALTSSTSGSSATRLIGTNAVSGLYGSFLYSDGLMATVCALAIMIV